jgi:hypothetical protein
MTEQKGCNTTPVGVWLDCLGLPDYKEHFFEHQLHSLKDIVDNYSSRYVCCTLFVTTYRVSSLSIDPTHLSTLQVNVTLLSTKSPDEWAYTTQRDIQGLCDLGGETMKVQRDKSRKAVPSKTKITSPPSSDPKKPKLKRSEP